MRKAVAVFLTAALAGACSLAFQAAKDKDQAPDEDKLFVWASPDKGQQSMLVLKVIDAETVEAAYLVPVVVVLKKGAAGKEAVDEAIGGRLLAFDLRGRDRFGRVQADVWLGKDAGWLSKLKPKEGKKK